jgi:hypothetical protein
MDDRRLTVAIPTYNGASHIEAAVRSILHQRDADFDLIVSDDRSSDDTLDRIRQLAGDRARIEVNSERLGLARNWNRCVERTQTPFVAIFHQDDVMMPGHLAAHLAAFAPGVGLVASAVEVVDARGEPIPPGRVEPGGCGPIDRIDPIGEFLRELAVSNPLRCSAVTLRVEAHRATGGFDPALRYVVDWDHWIKVARSWRVAWIASPTIQMRWHDASETHTFKSGTADLDESSQLVARLHESDPALASFAPAARARLARAYLNRAYDAARSGQPSLCRLALRRAVAQRPAILAEILRDPRLLARLASGSIGLGSRPNP